MAEDSNYKVPHRRRREQKTDYQQRRKLLKSDNPRVVVRTSNNHTKTHISYFERDGDRNTDFTTTEELAEYGWEHHTGNLPAAYLAGYLLGKRTEEDKAVLDIGLRESREGGRIYAAVKGMNDAGLEVPVGEEAYPDEDRVRGAHIDEIRDAGVEQNFEQVKENIEGEY